MSILEEILSHKKEVIKASKLKVSENDLLNKLKGPLQIPKFKTKISQNGINLIAEVKKASPSAGVIRKDFYPASIARAYEEAGAAALSVLTEDKYFMGGLKVLDEILAAVSLPVLRKDFIIDEYQIYETKAHGADAILLITRVLKTKDKISAFLKKTRELKLDAVVEVHDTEEFDIAVDSGAEIIGINTRNLNDFSINFDEAQKIIKNSAHLSLPFILESGIKNLSDLSSVKKTSVEAVLVGEALMCAEDIFSRTKEFVDFLKSHDQG